MYKFYTSEFMVFFTLTVEKQCSLECWPRKEMFIFDILPVQLHILSTTRNHQTKQTLIKDVKNLVRWLRFVALHCKSKAWFSYAPGLPAT